MASSGRSSLFVSRSFAGLALLVVVTLLAPAAHAQDDMEELDALKAERERIQAEAADKAGDVDAATADFDELAAALDALNAMVDLQEARLADAEQAVRSADALVQSAEERQAAIEAEVADLGGELSDLAVAAYTGEDGANGRDMTSLLLSNDPSQAARKQSLLQFHTGNLADGIDRMRALVAEAEVVSEQRRAAVAAAEAGRAEAEARATELDSARAAQLTLVTGAETRLEARLAEAAFIAERDADLAAQITRQEQVVASRLRREALERIAQARPQVPPPADIVNVQGIFVHESIAGALDRLLTDARNDGVSLGGWGYRDSLKQIELRQQHCGTSDYEIWDLPASSCSPPTARPGQSNHERGLAVDFTYNGGSMSSRSNPGFQWLAAHAHEYGFVNLPSEPWHWSATG